MRFSTNSEKKLDWRQKAGITCWIDFPHPEIHLLPQMSPAFQFLMKSITLDNEDNSSITSQKKEKESSLIFEVPPFEWGFFLKETVVTMSHSAS